MAEELTDAEKRFAKAALSLQKRKDALARDQAILENMESLQAGRDAMDRETGFAHALKMEQRQFMRIKRADFGMHRLQRKNETVSIRYTVFKVIYDDWIAAKKPLDGVRVRWDKLERRTTRKGRMVRTYVAGLLEEDLTRCGGGSGQGDPLRVVPTGYPIAVKDDGTFVRVEERINLPSPPPETPPPA